MPATSKNRKWIVALGILVLIPVLLFGGFGLYGLGQADKLPWQTPATRIPITPVEMPSFGVLGGTPAPDVVSTPAG